MQIVSAILQLVLIGFSLIPPTLIASDNSAVPDCCRRHGKHGCSMGKQTPVTDDSAVLRTVCPNYRKGGAVAASSQAATFFATRADSTIIVAEPSATAQAECLYRVSFTRTQQKRGPPSLL